MSTEQSRVKAQDPLVGRTIAGRFRVIEKVATGGMGLVYRAEQLPLKRDVALKVLESKRIPDLDESFRQRFFLEAAAAAKLAHPNTIVVYDYGQADDGAYYIAMEYVNGGTLERHLKTRGPLPPPQAIHVGLQVCSSLRDAHEQGLVHRDLKPGNVMFAPRAGDPFFVKVLDFGLVKVVSGADKESLGLTRSGIVMGSPRYMAPEQVRTLPVDHRSDIYSFGALFYHMLTGAPPFASGEAFDAMTAHVASQPPALRETWADCPAGPRLEALVMRCLEKRPEERFQSMYELMRELHACMEEAGAGLTSGSTYLPQLSSRPPADSSSPSFSDVPSRGSWSGAQPLAHRSGEHPKRADESAHDAFDVDVEATNAPPSNAPPMARPVRRAPMIVAGVLLGVAALAGGFVAALSLAGEDAPSVASAPSVQSVQEPSAPNVAGPHASAIDPVRIESEPSGASVRQDGSDLGDTPLSLPIPHGERWQVELVLDGYAPRRVTVIGGQPELTVRLRAEANTQLAAPAPAGAAKRWRPPATARSTTAPNDEGSTADLHDPWTEDE